MSFLVAEGSQPVAESKAAAGSLTVAPRQMAGLASGEARASGTMLASAAIEAAPPPAGTATTGTLTSSLGAPPVRTGIAVSLT